MNNSSNPNQDRQPEDVLEEQKRTDGETANQGERAGPSSDQDGRPIAPQTGDPHSDDRQS